MRKRLLAVLLTAAMLMSLCMPGLAVEPEDSGDEHVAEPVLVCAQEEHTHSRENGCYTVSEEPQCGQEETEGHAHTDECYASVESWACGLEETEGHAHSKDCYGETKTLICTETESDGHQHDDGCYETASEPSCGMAEGDGAHSHGDDCYSEEESLSCGSEEEGHEHDDGCYVTESVLSCGEQESEGHTHGDGCYASTLTCEVSVGDGAHHHVEDCYEVNEDLICELEEVEAHTHSDACGVTTVRGELLCELEEAAGHAHSEDCYLTLTCEKTEHQHTDACYEQTAAGGAGAAQCTCGAAEGEAHDEDCPLYEAPECTCGAGEGEAHSEGCPLYVAPECTCGAGEGELHAEGCPFYVAPECNCGAEGLFHATECPLYIEPITAEVYTEADGVYTSIAHGEKARLDVEEYDGQTLYVVAGDRPQNLYFMREVLGGLVGANFELTASDYAMLTSGDGVIADTHADVTLAGGIPAGTELTLTANKIISDSYVVNIVVLDELPEEDMDPLVLIQQVVELGDGSRLEASFGEGAFGDDASVELTANSFELDENEIAEIQSAIESLDMEDVDITEVLHFYGLDINFDDEQPLEGARVSLTLSLPSEETPDGANMIFIVHLHEDGAEILGHSYVSAESEQQVLSFGTDSFSHYVAVYASGKYKAQKLEDVLDSNNRFEIQNFNVNLFDYDPIEFNQYVNSEITPQTDADGNTTAGNFLFKGKSYGNETDDGSEGSGVNNTDSMYVKQGILNNSLNRDGLPTMKFVADGERNAELFFATTNLNDEDGKAVKTVYENVDFQFVHDTETGDYIYKSAANHAQLNDDKDAVELYADNLAVINNEISSLGLGGYYTNVSGAENFDGTNYYKDVSNLTFENGVLSGTAKDTNDSMTVDPTITYGTLNLTASDISKIYVKLKASGDGTEEFQIFYHVTGMEGNYFQEPYSFKVSYNANEGDYIEIVLDTSLNNEGDAGSNNWSGTIEAIRVDPRSSEGTFEIAEISFLGTPEININSKQNGGFYPFSDIKDSYPGQKAAFNETEWEEFVTDGSTLFQNASRAIANTTGQISTYDHLAFGMTMEVDFYLPIGTNESNGQYDDTDFVYEFTGDDDLWVFIDGYLVLDMGGGHGAIKGSINFTEGEVNVANAVTVTAYDAVSSSASFVKTSLVDCVTDNSGAVLNAPGKHTMKIFYLERGASVSNCYMRFNLPLTPQGALTVTKKVVHETYDPDQTYTFTITGENETAGSPMNGKLADLPYYVIGGGISTALTTNEDGQFMLQAGQTAVFGAIDEGTTVTVTESLPSGGQYYIYEGTSIVISDGSDGAKTGPSDAETTVRGQLWASDLIGAESSVKFTFTNYYRDFFGSIVITKKIQDETNPDQSFLFRLKSDQLYCKTDKPVDMTVILSKDQFENGTASITIEHLPAGVYSVKEDESWSWRYDLTGTVSSSRSSNVVESVNLKAQGNQTGQYTFTNARDDGKWLDGESWCRNIFDATTPPHAEGDVINKQKSDDEG